MCKLFTMVAVDYIITYRNCSKNNNGIIFIPAVLKMDTSNDGIIDGIYINIHNNI